MNIFSDKRALVAYVLLMLVVSPVLTWAGDESAEPQSDATRECVENFSVAGSFFKGKQYKTWHDYKDAEFDTIFRRVAQAVAANNYSNVSADKDLGIVTAGVTVIMGEGAEAPLNVVIKEMTGGVIRVEANFGTAGGHSAAKKTVREELCKLVEAALD